MGVRPKVFINGISGLLGFHLAWHLRHKYLVSGTTFRNSISMPGVQVIPVSLKTPDVLEAVIRMQGPDFLISAVGMSDRKQVDDQPKVSDMINVTIPVSTAILAGRLKCKYIALSCAEVFDGNKGDYVEEDTDFTLNDSVGKQKITAYSYIRAQSMESTTLRIGRVLGMGHHYRQSFFDRIRAGAAARLPYEASQRKMRSYISTLNLTNAVDGILKGEFPSRHRVLHVGGANMTEFDCVQGWYKLMGADTRLVSDLQDSKRDLSLNCNLMETQYSPWKAESKRELMQNMLTDLNPAIGTKKWQNALKGLDT
jgi:dTDP-4-dehydrorhamnose reductase